MKSNLENLNFQTSIREQVVPSRKKIILPAWLEVAKPRLIPLLLATTSVSYTHLTLPTTPYV